MVSAPKSGLVNALKMAAVPGCKNGRGSKVPGLKSERGNALKMEVVAARKIAGGWGGASLIMETCWTPPRV